MICALAHWGRVTHISCVSKLIIIGLDNGLSPGRRQAITWTNARKLLIGPIETNFSEILIEIHTFSLKKMHLKMSSAKCRPFGLGLNVLTHCGLLMPLNECFPSFKHGSPLSIMLKKKWIQIWLFQVPFRQPKTKNLVAPMYFLLSRAMALLKPVYILLHKNRMKKLASNVC